MPAHTPSPASATRRLCLLSNGAYSVMLSDSVPVSADGARMPPAIAGAVYLLLRDEDSGAV